jgi:hypothetical protein
MRLVPANRTNQLLIEKVRRVGHGYRNVDNDRLRLLLDCGVDWQTPVATPIRGRLPRLVAKSPKSLPRVRMS